jgi:putative ABC transport system substrate-binding protein
VNRRTFVAGAVGLVGGPRGAEAEQGTRIPRVGVLALGSPTPDRIALDESFRQALRELGHVEGRSITIEWRWAEGKLDQLPRLAAELVQRPVDVIVTGATSSTRAAKQATTTIPIVMVTVPDPVEAGLVRSLGHPGGNITGTTLMTPELSGKQLELLKEVVPSAARVGVLRDPRGTGHRITLHAAEAAARALRLDLRIVDARGPDDFQPAFTLLRRERVGAVLVLAHPTFFGHRLRLAEAANESRLPTLYGAIEHAHAGGLMAYAASVVESYRRGAVFVDRILKGAKPADLPVEQPTKFDLIINMKTAKALGLTIPPAVLARADHVIE